MMSSSTQNYSSLKNSTWPHILMVGQTWSNVLKTCIIWYGSLQVDMKFIMEALTSEVKRIFKAELEQFHERVEQSFEQPRNPPTRRRRERLPRRGVRVEEDEYVGNGFKDENDHDSAVGDRRYEGRLREARNWEDNNLRNIKM